MKDLDYLYEQCIQQIEEQQKGYIEKQATKINSILSELEVLKVSMDSLCKLSKSFKEKDAGTAVQKLMIEYIRVLDRQVKEIQGLAECKKDLITLTSGVVQSMNYYSLEYNAELYAMVEEVLSNQNKGS